MHINQTSLVIMLVMVQQVQMVQISLVLTLVKVRHLLITQISLGNQAGYKHQMLLFKFLGPTSWL
jgi:hypothetical protein